MYSPDRKDSTTPGTGANQEGQVINAKSGYVGDESAQAQGLNAEIKEGDGDQPQNA
jgi:hypothetical protein